MDDLEKNRALLLCCFKLYPSFHSHHWIQTGVIVRKLPIWVKIGDCFVPSDLEIRLMTLKTIGHLFYAASSFVHRFIAITEFKLELQPETPNSGQNRRFASLVTLKLDGWPWKTIGHLFHATSCFVRHFKAPGEFKLEYQPGNAQFGLKWAIFFLCDREIWWMTLENNRAPLLCCFKLYASFHSYHWIETGVTGRKRPIWVKIGDFYAPVTLKFDGWSWKKIGHFS